MTAAVAERFAQSPLAGDSAQFPLGPHPGAAAQDVPSPIGVRPWGLAGMRPARCQGDPVRERFTYDHCRQIAVDEHGRTLVVAGPTAKSVSNNDGDEGPSEDWENDFAPDQPFQV